MQNSQKFISLFKKLEKLAADKSNLSKKANFSDRLSELTKGNNVFRYYKADLQKLKDLRNAIIHGSVEDGRAIAEPHEDIVSKLEEIVEKIENPPKVVPQFNYPVETVSTEDEISKALRLMYEGEFSQLPVMREDKCIDLLTANTFSRWLGANIEEEFAIIEGTTISEVLEYKEGVENFKFISRSTSLIEAYKMFENLKENRAPLDALLITQNGKSHESLLGIITHYDIPDILLKI